MGILHDYMSCLTTLEPFRYQNGFMTQNGMTRIPELLSELTILYLCQLPLAPMPRRLGEVVDVVGMVADR